MVDQTDCIWSFVGTYKLFCWVSLHLHLITQTKFQFHLVTVESLFAAIPLFLLKRHILPCLVFPYFHLLLLFIIWHGGVCLLSHALTTNSFTLPFYEQEPSWAWWLLEDRGVTEQSPMQASSTPARSTMLSLTLAICLTPISNITVSVKDVTIEALKGDCRHLRSA